jgi:hypothetical protein
MGKSGHARLSMALVLVSLLRGAPLHTADMPLYLAIVGKYMELAIRAEVAPDTMVVQLCRPIAEVNSGPDRDEDLRPCLHSFPLGKYFMIYRIEVHARLAAKC